MYVLFNFRYNFRRKINLLMSKLLIKKNVALIVRELEKNPYSFFYTKQCYTNNLGNYRNIKKHIIKTLFNQKRLTKILSTTEVIFLKGELTFYFYTQNRKYLFSKVLKK